MALHGCTQTASDFAAGTRFDSVAERSGAYVIYPEQSVLVNPNRCWNWFVEANQYRAGDEPAAILSLIDDVLARHPIDRERVFVAGLSAGGALAAILAEQAPETFAAVGVMAGVPLHASRDVASAHAAMRGNLERAHVSRLTTADASRAYGRMRATLWTGAHDRTVDPANTFALARQFLELFELERAIPTLEDADGASIERWRDAAGTVRVETWSVRDMGHAWSGGSFRGSHTFPRGPRAADAMMAFFLAERSVPA